MRRRPAGFPNRGWESSDRIGCKRCDKDNLIIALAIEWNIGVSLTILFSTYQLGACRVLTYINGHTRQPLQI